MAVDLLSCSWPRPVRAAERRWTSDPEWDAPLMPRLPCSHVRNIDGCNCWAIDWCHVFGQSLRFHRAWQAGEMRCFHVVFKLRVSDSGTLVFWDDDGSIIRRNGKIVHEDRECHPLVRHELQVRAGDCLEIAQWQYHGAWVWGGKLERGSDNSAATLDIFREYLPVMQRELRKPNGPPLKMYSAAAVPARSILCLYSMVLNGYRPSSVHIFGEYQWNSEAREILSTLLPFAQIVPTAEVHARLHAIRPELAELAMRSWCVMKLCAGVLCPPNEYCLMDDDMFIVDSVDDAMSEFTKCDLVYASDADYSNDYRNMLHLEPSHPLPTGNVNTGLYWLRNTHDPAEVAERLLAAAHTYAPSWLWEQGFMALEYSRDRSCALSAQRYFYPFFDGLPGGMTGYDYGRNPCGFASVHFGGLAEKPSDADSRMLAAQILKRRAKGRVRASHGDR
jgi:hypothetical protein